jgi:hypothetical protein
MTDDECTFDPLKRAKKRAPSKKEIERAEKQTLRAMASIGAENAIPILTNLLGSFLWSEHLPPSGAQFDEFIDELARALSVQIERLDSDLATISAQTKGHSHAWH